MTVMNDMTNLTNFLKISFLLHFISPILPLHSSEMGLLGVFFLHRVNVK